MAKPQLLAIAFLAAIIAISPLAQGQSYSPQSSSPSSALTQYATGTMTASWFDPPALLACPCQSINLPLLVENTLNSPTTLDSSFYPASQDLTGFTNGQQELGPISTGSAQVSISVACTAQAGTEPFSVQLTQSNSSTGQVISTQQIPATLQVLSCGSLDLEATSAALLCPDSQISYSFTLTNNGLYTQSGTLSVSGVKASYYLLSPSDFLLTPGQTQQVTVLFSPPYTYIQQQGDSMALTATGNDSSAYATVPLRQAYCPVNYNSTNLPTNPGTPSKPSSGSRTGGSGTSGSGLSSYFTPITGFFTRLNTPITYVGLVILIAIILVLLYANKSVNESLNEDDSAPSDKPSSPDSSTRRAMRVAYAVENF